MLGPLPHHPIMRPARLTRLYSETGIVKNKDR
jgi:hypothetical protein